MGFYVFIYFIYCDIIILGTEKKMIFFFDCHENNAQKKHIPKVKKHA